MPEYHLHFHLSADEYMRFYKGTASVVIARAADGTRVQFPANALRPYVTNEGVSGRFLLRTDENHKLIELLRL